MEVLPGPLPDGRRSGGDEGLGSRLGAFFRHFCVSTVITIAHAHKSGVIFHIFQDLSNKKKIKALQK